MRNSEQLEREAEQTRAQLTQTLDELRERITPGELVDQAVDYAKESGGGDFVRNMGRQMADNPLPVCLMGAGLAWLMLSNRRSTTSDMRAAERVSRGTRDVRDTVDTTAREARERAGETVQNMGEQVGAWSADARDRAADAADAAGQQAKDIGNVVRSKFEQGSQRAHAQIG